MRLSHVQIVSDGSATVTRSDSVGRKCDRHTFRQCRTEVRLRVKVTLSLLHRGGGGVNAIRCFHWLSWPRCRIRIARVGSPSDTRDEHIVIATHLISHG